MLLIEKGKPTERRGRKASGLRLNKMPDSGVADRNRHQRAVVFPTLVSYPARRKPNIWQCGDTDMRQATTAKYLIRLAAAAALTLALAACGSSSSGSTTPIDP